MQTTKLINKLHELYCFIKFNPKEKNVLWRCNSNVALGEVADGAKRDRQTLITVCDTSQGLLHKTIHAVFFISTDYSFYAQYRQIFPKESDCT